MKLHTYRLAFPMRIICCKQTEKIYFSSKDTLEKYEIAWQNFVISELTGTYFPLEVSQSISLLDKLSKIEKQHKREWIKQLQDHHNKKFWANYIQDRKSQIGKNNLSTK